MPPKGSKGSKGKKGKKGKKKSISKEEEELRAIAAELQQIFELFDEDKDNLLTIREFGFFMEACATPLPPEMDLQATGTEFVDLTAAATIVRQVRKDTHEADRLKNEFYSLLNQSEEPAGPLVTAEKMKEILCGPPVGKIVPRDIMFLTRFIRKPLTTQQLLQQKQREREREAELDKLRAKGELPPPNPVVESKNATVLQQLEERKKTNPELIDLRDVIKIMTQNRVAKTSILPLDELEKRLKEIAKQEAQKKSQKKDGGEKGKKGTKGKKGK